MMTAIPEMEMRQWVMGHVDHGSQKMGREEWGGEGGRMRSWTRGNVGMGNVGEVGKDCAVRKIPLENRVLEPSLSLTQIDARG